MQCQFERQQCLINLSVSSLPGYWCNNSHIKFPFLHSLHVSCLQWVNQKRAPLPSASLCASQGNVTGFKAVKSLLHRLTGVSLASWQELLGNRCYGSVGGSTAHRMHIHTHAYAHIFLSFLQQLTMTDFKTLREDLGSFWKHQKAYCQNREPQKLGGRQLHKHNANKCRIGSAVRV